MTHQQKKCAPSFQFQSSELRLEEFCSNFVGSKFFKNSKAIWLSGHKSLKIRIYVLPQLLDPDLCKLDRKFCAKIRIFMLHHPLILLFTDTLKLCLVIMSYLYFWIRIFPNLTENSVPSWHLFEVPVRAEIRDFVVWKVSIVGNLLELLWVLCF
jgi:hypothetical protein